MRALFLTFNMGGYFDSPNFENYRDVWVEYVGKLVRACSSAVFVVHFQELGGKEKCVELVPDVIQALDANFLSQGDYWSSGLIASLDTKGEFTALGTMVFVRADLVDASQVWNFTTSTFASLSNFGALESDVRFREFAQHKRIMFGPAKSRKGFLHMRWHISGTTKPITLVNVHLVHDESNIVAAVEPFPSSYAVRRMRAVNAILNAVDTHDDLGFYFGDFNFRLDLNHFVPWVAEDHKRRAKQISVMSTAGNRVKQWTTRMSSKTNSDKHKQQQQQETQLTRAASDTRAPPPPAVPDRAYESSSSLECSSTGPVYTPRRLSNIASDPTGAIDSASLKTMLSSIEGSGGEHAATGVADYRVMVLMAMSGLTLTTSLSSPSLSRGHHDKSGVGHRTSHKALIAKLCRCFAGSKDDEPPPFQPLQPTSQDDLSPEQLSVLKEAFQKFDANSDGTISATELADALRFAGLDFTEDEMRQVIRRVDADNSGDIDFPEFLTLMTRHVSQSFEAACASDVIEDEIVFREVNGTDKQFVPSKTRVSVQEIGLSQSPHEVVSGREYYTKGSLKVMHDKEKGIVLGDKKFVFYQRDELAMSRELQAAVKFFDRELALFNDCRMEQARQPLYEMHLTFPPTFPLDEHDVRDSGFVYSETRCPSWCDRVVMNKAAQDNVIQNEKLQSEDLAELVRLMDQHPPVLMGMPIPHSITHSAGNLYGALHTHKMVSDHAAVLLLVNIS